MKTVIKRPKQVIAPRTAKILRARLNELDMNPRELAIKTDHAYDHIRLIVKGEKFGSRYVIREIGTKLGLNEEELMNAYREDKAEKAGYKIKPMEPKLAMLTSIFNQLPDAARDQLLTFAEFTRNSTAMNETQHSVAQ